MRVVRSTVAVALLTGMAGWAALGAAATAAAPAAADPAVKIVAAQVAHRSITAPTRDNPVRIDPKVRSPLSVTLRNDGTTTVHVRYLRLSGALLGIHFVNYQASTNVDVAPGTTATVTTPGDFFDVDGVAMGYVNARMQVVDDQRNAVAGQDFVADVRGKLASSEGLFVLEVLAFALVSLLDIGLGVARRRLPRNRFVCGILFAFAAASTVLTIVAAAAMARVALFEVTAWVPALLVATAGSFLLGYLSPGRLTRTAPEATEDRVLDLVAAEAVARATGDQERRTTGGGVAHTSGDHTGAAAAHESGEFAAHESGGFTAAHESGGFTAAHESGGFAAAHESGGFEPAVAHDSGGFTPPAAEPAGTAREGAASAAEGGTDTEPLQ